MIAVPGEFAIVTYVFSSIVVSIYRGVECRRGITFPRRRGELFAARRQSGESQ